MYIYYVFHLNVRFKEPIIDVFVCLCVLLVSYTTDFEPTTSLSTLFLQECAASFESEFIWKSYHWHILDLYMLIYKKRRHHLSQKEWILLITWKQTYLILKRVLLFDEKLSRTTIYASIPDSLTYHPKYNDKKNLIFVLVCMPLLWTQWLCYYQLSRA